MASRAVDWMSISPAELPAQNMKAMATYEARPSQGARPPVRRRQRCHESPEMWSPSDEKSSSKVYGSRDAAAPQSKRKPMDAGSPPFLVAAGRCRSSSP
ncbi:hypothetical protein TRIUR3_15693 [Triticum urartu]|uniref:Uncharacterized protein n=1 Tax=Triticum urartu TaxID=4572 RepID=M7ZKJ8_TRIUA|nr:hypothetical protein TRIUR3_15693 [Triticum urartu]